MGGGGYGQSVAITPGMRVADWLQANGLQACMGVLSELGYDEGIDMLVESDNEEQQDMVNAVRQAPLVPHSPASFEPPVFLLE